MPRTVYVMQPIYGPGAVQMPGPYQNLGAVSTPSMQGQPLPNHMFMHPPPNELPAHPAPTLAADTKQGPERFA